MTQDEIKDLCREKEQELLEKYFGNLVHEAAIEMPETIGKYTKDLPLKIEAEYRALILSQKVCLKGSKKGPTLAWQP